MSPARFLRMSLKRGVPGWKLDSSQASRDWVFDVEFRVGSPLERGALSF